MAFSGQGAGAGAIGGAALGGKEGGPWGAAAGAVLGAIGGGILGGQTNIAYDPQTIQLANLSNEQWFQATQQMYGLENQLIKYAEDPNAVANAQQNAITQTGQQFAASEASAQRNLQGMGITMTPEMRAEMNRQNQLTQTASAAGNANAAGLQAYALQRQVLGGAR